MIPIMQTLFGDKKGNCFPACIASILEVPLDRVPNFCVDFPNSWSQEANRWLARNHKLGLATVQVPEGTSYDDLMLPRDCHHIITAKSPRGDFNHCVVGMNGIIIHDPHPSGDGLADGSDCYFDFFVKIL